MIYRESFSIGRGYETREFRTSGTKNQLKRLKTTLDDREREREPDIDGQRGALRWCPVVLRLDYAAKIEILDSSETGREDEGLTGSTFIVSASALLPPPLYRR